MSEKNVNAWWWMQSRSNRSQHPNSLIYGNLQGIFCSLQGIPPLGTSKTHARLGDYTEIPYGKEQGIFKGLTSKNREMLAPKRQTARWASDDLFWASKSHGPVPRPELRALRLALNSDH